MRGEERRNEPRQAGLRSEIAQELEGAELVADRQAVAGLRLAVVVPCAQHPREASRHGLAQLRRPLAARVARTVATIPPPVGRDRGVALAGEPPADLRPAVPEPDRMRVRVDEARE